MLFNKIATISVTEWIRVSVYVLDWQPPYFHCWSVHEFTSRLVVMTNWIMMMMIIIIQFSLIKVLVKQKKWPITELEFIIIIIVVVIIIIIISFMQGIYIYIPETNYVPMEYSVAAILLLLLLLLNYIWKRHKCQRYHHYVARTGYHRSNSTRKLTR